ncbi:TetR family transcriptional regulator [Auritidibacter sp. NML120779]|nr:TetR family transcriptional regulator [Auritidibacter sp. NML120779]
MADVTHGNMSSKARIRTAALKLFAAHGHHAVSLRQIAEATPIAHGSVVHHFGSKAGLIRAVEDDILARLREALDDLPPDIRTAEELRRIRDANVGRLLEANPEIVDYARRVLLAPGTDAEGASGLSHRIAELTRSVVRGARSTGFSTSTRSEAVQVAELLVRYLGRLFLAPMLDHIWDGLEDSEGLPPRSTTDLTVRVTYSSDKQE